MYFILLGFPELNSSKICGFWIYFTFCPKNECQKRNKTDLTTYKRTLLFTMYQHSILKKTNLQIQIVKIQIFRKFNSDIFTIVNIPNVVVHEK